MSWVPQHISVLGKYVVGGFSPRFHGAECEKRMLKDALPHSPLKLGGVAAPLRKCREASLAAQTGWFQWGNVSALPRSMMDFGARNHPGASRHPSYLRRGVRQQSL